eukprot:8119670-Pyramimonas_sp.AAC.1
MDDNMGHNMDRQSPTPGGVKSSRTLSICLIGQDLSLSLSAFNPVGRSVLQLVVHRPFDRAVWHSRSWC